MSEPRKTRFHALRIVASIQIVLSAVLALGVMAAGGFYAIGAYQQSLVMGIAQSVAAVVAGILVWSLFAAGGELIYVFLSIEENVRAIAGNHADTGTGEAEGSGPPRGLPRPTVK